MSVIKLSMALELAVLATSLTACASSAPPRVVYQDHMTVVQLRVDTKAAEEHSHPAKLTPEQVKEILSGIRIQKRQEPVLSLIMGQSEVVPAFTLGELQVLAVPISTGLATAAPNELVTFYRRVSDAQIGLGFTTGGVFVQEGLVYVVLANHQVKPMDGIVRDVPMYPIDPIDDPLLSLGATIPVLSFVRPEAEVRPVHWSGRYDRSRVLIVDPILAHRHAPSTPASPQP